MKIGLVQAMARASQIRPGETAVIDSAMRLTWSEAAARTGRLAGGLRSLGIADGRRVAVLALNSARVYEVFFATLWAGGVVAPLNHRLSRPELVGQLERAAPDILMFGHEFEDAAEALRIARPGLRTVRIGDGEDGSDALIACSAPIEPALRGGDDDALLFFAGGTTGEPKGVMLSHANMAANSINFIAEMKLDERTAHLHCGPLFHVAAAARLFSVTQVAGTHVFLPRFEACEVLATIARERITLATFVPTMIRSLLDTMPRGAADIGSLEYITYGAAPMPEALLRELMQAMPHVKLVQSYGMTESSPILTMLGSRDHARADRLRSAGRAALLAEVRVVDAAGRAVPVGSLGEVVARGPMVMSGYWQAPEATAATIRDGWLHTGDVGYLDAEGYLFIVDRLKDVIISGGENIYSQEVENAVASHPAVKACAVIGRPDERWGEAVHAVVVPRDGMTLTAEAVIAHCRSSIAAYKSPKTVDIRHDDLPLSGTNKVDKVRLRRELMQQTDQSRVSSITR